MALMDHFSLVETLALDRRKLQSTLETIEQGYNACVYHNRLHAADVMHGVFCLLLEAVCVRASPARAASPHARMHALACVFCGPALASGCLQSMLSRSIAAGGLAIVCHRLAIVCHRRQSSCYLRQSPCYRVLSPRGPEQTHSGLVLNRCRTFSRS